jgi:signal transduction histidine kinase/CheY-like chemotaxis protein
MLADGHDRLDEILLRLCPDRVQGRDLRIRHQLRLILVFGLVGLLLAIGFCLLFWLVLGCPLGGLGILLAGLLVAAAPLLFCWSGSIAACGHLLAGVLVAVSSFVALIRGGFAVSGLAFVLPVPLLATFLAGRRAALVWSLISALAIAGFGLRAWLGWAEWRLYAVSPALDLFQDGFGLLAALVLMLALARAQAASRQAVERERQRVQQRLERAQRLESLGQMAGSVAHDFNNLLTVIRGNLELVQPELQPGHPLADDLAEIRRAAERATGLTEQLLLFSRRELVPPEPVALDELIEQLAPMLRRSLPEDIELKLTSADDLPPALADGGQLEQVLLNLIINARDAMPEGGRIELRVGRQQVAAAAEQRPDELPDGIAAGHYDRIDVIDQGCGMPPEVAERAFEPFFTTKPRGAGSGLGLATAYGMVRRYGGSAYLVSQPGAGTRVTLLLPQAEQDAAGAAGQEPAAAAARPAAAAAQRVLLAEDDGAVRRTVSQMLRRAGYHVLVAADGEQAERIAGRSQQPIDLLLTDVVMPRLSGPRLAERVRRLQPGLPVLFISGYTDGEMERSGLAGGPLHLLRKPFTTAELLAAVERALAGEPGRREPPAVA